MAEMDGYGDSSQVNSDDLLWEAVTEDIAVRRAYQDEQLQTLKGKVLRRPHHKLQSQRYVGKGKSAVKKLFKKKAVLKALEVIKRFTNKIKLKAGTTRVKKPSITFEVCYSPPESDIVTENHIQGEPSSEEKNKSSDTNEYVRDQIVQTAEISLVDKLCQTDFPEKNEERNANKCVPEIVNCKIPVFMSPFPYGLSLCGSGNTCCSNSKGRACSCSSSQVTQNCQNPMNSVAHESIRADDVSNATSQHYLKQICEELCLKLFEKLNGTTKHSNSVPSVAERVSENLLTRSEGPSVQSNEPVNTVKSQQFDKEILIVNRVSANTEIPQMLSSSKEPCQVFSSNVARQVTNSLMNGPCAYNKAKDVTVPVPPDLLRCSVACHSPNSKDVAIDDYDQITRVYDFQCASDNTIGMMPAVDRITDRPKGSMLKMRMTQSNSVMPPKTMHNEIGVSRIPSTTSNESSDSAQKSLSLTKASDKLTCTSSENVATDISKPSVVTLNKNCDHPRDRVTKTLFTVSGRSNDGSLAGVLKPLQDGHTPMDSASLDKFRMNNVEDRGNGAFRPVTTTEVLSLESKSDNCNTSLEESTTKKCPVELRGIGLDGTGEKSSEQELRVQPGLKNVNVTNLSRKQAVSSPAFEELDSSEMENVLMVCRQQELFHQDTEQTTEISALDVTKPLDQTPKPIEDDDDVPEISPQPVPHHSKRRKTLRLKPTPALKLVIEKNQDLTGSQNPSTPAEKSIGKTASASLPNDSGKNKGEAGKRTESGSETENMPLVLRSSKRLKIAQSKKGTGTVLIESKSQMNTVKSGTKVASENSHVVKSKNNEREKSSESNATIQVNEKTTTSEGNVSAGLKSSLETEGTEKNFQDQIKERCDKLNKHWHSEKSSDDIFLSPAAVVSISSRSNDLGTTPPFNDVSKVKAVPAIEFGKAHDMVVSTILNPWRGLNARPVTRGFVSPNFVKSPISEVLWRLRRDSISKDVAVKEIMSMDYWKDINPHAFLSLVSMFMFSFTRDVPFVFESSGEEDDAFSLCSEADLPSKKVTPLRLKAKEKIFKGQQIESLNGLLIKIPSDVKAKLKRWCLPKFKQRDWAIFGPLAYLKRSETDYNTVAVPVQGELISVKAKRHILVGERLVASFEDLEQSLLKFD